MSLRNTNAVTEGAENSVVVIKTLMHVLKNLKKLKEAEMKVCIISISLYLDFNEIIHMD